eukprot:TCONS_00029028-protein
MKCFPWPTTTNHPRYFDIRGAYSPLPMLTERHPSAIPQCNATRRPQFNSDDDRVAQAEFFMKTDRRKCFMLVLGVLQILLGSLFLSLGLWSVMIVRSALYATGLSPFFLAVLSYVGGGLTVYGPRSTNNNLVMLVIGVSTFTCFLSLSLGCWMFISLMHSSAPNITSYKSFLMGLNVFLMLDTGIIASSTWTLKETVRRRRNRNRPTDPLRDPPPAYFPPGTAATSTSSSNDTPRMVYTGETVTQINNESPPPYEP